MKTQTMLTWATNAAEDTEARAVVAGGWVTETPWTPTRVPAAALPALTTVGDILWIINKWIKK